jgi:acyl-CoA thioesterase FadM
VHAECDFSYPLRFEDSVEVRLLVREKRQKSLVYSFIFRKLNGDAPREVARGTLAVACVKRDNATGKLTAVPIPEAIAGKIEVAPPEALDT